MLTFKDLPHYRTTKTVAAAKIVDIDRVDEASRVYLKVDTGHTHIADISWFERHCPAVGDYLVVYDNDYASTCPADVFERSATGLSAKEAAKGLPVAKKIIDRVSRIMELMFYKGCVHVSNRPKLGVDTQVISSEVVGLRLADNTELLVDRSFIDLTELEIGGFIITFTDGTYVYREHITF